MGGVRVLQGTYDGAQPAAVMVDGLTDYPFGPLWSGHEAVDHIDAFQAWLRTGVFMSRPYDIDLATHDLPALGRDGFDPRDWPATGLAKLVTYWRRTHLNSDGVLDAVPASPA